MKGKPSPKVGPKQDFSRCPGPLICTGASLVPRTPEEGRREPWIGRGLLHQSLALLRPGASSSALLVCVLIYSVGSDNNNKTYFGGSSCGLNGA